MGRVNSFVAAVLEKKSKTRLVTSDGHVLINNATGLDEKKKFFRVIINEMVIEEDLTGASGPPDESFSKSLVPTIILKGNLHH